MQQEREYRSSKKQVDRPPAYLIELSSHRQTAFTVYHQKYREVVHSTVTKSSLPGLAQLTVQFRILRITWLLLFVCGVAMSCVQIYHQVCEYIDTPVEVNIDMRYANNVSFPALAVCNNNKYSALRFARNNFTGVLYELSLGKVKQGRDKAWTKMMYDLRNSSSRDFVTTFGRTREQLLLSCTWPDGTDCEQNWEPFYTDFDGICFALNTDRRTPYIIKTVGAKRGLKIVLNTEAYDALNTRCEADTAGSPIEQRGVRVIIFNQTEYPLKAKGFTVPVGAAVYLGITERRNIRVPHKSGLCLEGPQSSLFFDRLDARGRDACILDQQYRRILKHCGCLPFNVPAYVNKSNPVAPFCNLSQAFRCVGRYFYQLPMHTACLDACETTEFEVGQSWTALPYEQLTIFDEATPNNSWSRGHSGKVLTGCAAQLISNRERSRLLRQHEEAIEVKSRYEAESVDKMMRIIRDLKGAYEILEQNRWTPDERFEHISYKLHQDSDCLLNRSEFRRLAPIRSQYFPKRELIKLTSPGNDTYAAYMDGLNETELEAAYEEFTKRTSIKTLDKRLKEIFRSVSLSQQIMVDILTLKPVTIGPLVEFSTVKKMLDDYESGRITKKQLADKFLSDQMRLYTENTFHEKFRAKVDASLVWLRKTLRMVSKVEVKVIDSILKENYRRLPLSALMLHYALNRQTLAQTRNTLQQLSICYVNATRIALEYHRNFLYATSNYQINLNRLSEELTLHLEKFDFGPKFMEENFIYLNVYFQNLKIATFTQQMAYNYWSLLADIGGTISLFLGASIVGLVELLWLCITEATVAKRRKLNTSQRRRIQKLVQRQQVVDDWGGPLRRRNAAAHARRQMQEGEETENMLGTPGH